MKRFRDGLVFKARRLLYHSTLCSKVIKENNLKVFYAKNKTVVRGLQQERTVVNRRPLSKENVSTRKAFFVSIVPQRDQNWSVLNFGELQLNFG